MRLEIEYNLRMIYIAFVTKGLETISRDELSSIDGVEIISVDQKFIRFSYQGNIEALKNLKTVDDIGILIADIEIDSLITLKLDSEVDLIKKVVPFISNLRDVNRSFSLTISKYRNEEVNVEDMKLTLSKYFTDKLGFSFQPLEHTNFDIRLSMNQSICTISVKLFPESLYKRSYNHESNLGAIKSTIAASMLYKLANGLGKVKVVDTFCGSGTILCEALIYGYHVYGGDIDPEAVGIALKNLNRIKNGSYDLRTEDATKTSWADNSFDIAVSNFPWDKQIKVNHMYKLIEGSIKEYRRILKRVSYIGIISTKPQIVVKLLKKYFEVTNIEEYKIGYLGQTPTIVFANLIKS